MRKDSNLLLIETMVEEMKQTGKININNLKRIINRICYPNVCNDIIINDTARELFVMNVYPFYKDLDNMAHDIINSTNNEYDSYKKYEFIIEIDKKAIMDKSYGFNSDEITAVIAHEIGHVQNIEMNYNEIKEFYMEALNKEILDNKNTDVIMKQKNKVSLQLVKMYIIDQLDKLSFANLLMKRSVQEERIADAYVVKLGYQEALISAIDKVKKHFRKTPLKTNGEFINNATNYVKIMMVADSRQVYIKNMIKNEKRVTEKSYIKSMLDNIVMNLDKLKFDSRSRINTHLDDVLNENFITDFLFNPIKVSQKDIDELTIEFEMVETYNDKMALMYKIHRRLIQLDTSKNKCVDEKQKLNVIKTYEKQLLDLLTKCMKIKIVDKQYGVFVKYPKGYEG